jgi:predicted nuclease of predicted toxin-antitoxin system
MKLLLDECVPRKIRLLFEADGIFCETVRDAGWSGKENGELLSLAEQQYEVLLTIDKNIRHQQNLVGRNISILIIRTASNDYEDIRHHIPAAIEALKRIRPGQFIEVGTTLKFLSVLIHSISRKISTTLGRCSSHSQPEQPVALVRLGRSRFEE